MYIRKTIDEWQLWSNYGYGWECETTYSTRKEAIQGRHEYVINGGGVYRLKKVRIKINV